MTSEPVVGHNGQVGIDDRFLTIYRRGFRARTTVGKGQKRIPVGQITAVQWKPAGLTTHGYISFSLAGGVERRSRFLTQSAAAMNDENTVVFRRSQQPAFEELRTAVEDRIG